MQRLYMGLQQTCQIACSVCLAPLIVTTVITRSYPFVFSCIKKVGERESVSWRECSVIDKSQNGIPT